MLKIDFVELSNSKWTKYHLLSLHQINKFNLILHFSTINLYKICLIIHNYEERAL